MTLPASAVVLSANALNVAPASQTGLKLRSLRKLPNA